MINIISTKTLKFLILIFCIFIAILAVYVFVYFLPNAKRASIEKQKSEIQKQSEELQQLKNYEQEILVKKKAEEDKLNETVVRKTVGTSMKQYGINEGEFIFYINKECNVGDICVFLCFADKCMHDGHEMFLKKLIKKEGNCYWFEGNPKPWIENGAEFESWDSRKYGWLCHGEIYIHGVLKSNNNYTEGVDEPPTLDLTAGYKCEDSNYPSPDVLNLKLPDQDKFKIGDKFTLASGKKLLIKEVEVGNFYLDGSKIMKAQISIRVEYDNGPLDKNDICKMFITKGDEIIKLSNIRGANDGQYWFETQKTSNFDGMELHFGNEAIIILDQYIKANDL